MKILVALAILGVVFYALLWVLARIPVRHRNLSPERLEALLKALLTRGEAGSLLMIEVRGDERFVQFKLYDEPSHGRGIRSDFPRAPWSEPFYEDVATLLRESSRPFDRTPVAGTDVPEFLTQDFRRNVAEAQRFATDVLVRIFRVSPQDDCVATLRGVRD